MLKKIIPIGGLILLSVGLFFFFQKDSPQNRTKQKEMSEQPSSIDLPLDMDKPKGKQNTTSAPQGLSDKLIDRKISPQERVYLVKDLDLNPSSDRGAKNLDSLVVFINSENDLINDPEAHEHNSYKANLLQKEASLRVYAIKRINELDYPQSRSFLESIISKAKDPALIRIAKQVLEHKKRGEDYFENIKKGILQMDGGLGDKPNEEDHKGGDHHDHGH